MTTCKKILNAILATTAITFFLTDCNYKVNKIDDTADNGQSNLSNEELITDKLILTYSLNTCRNCHAGAQAPLLDSATAMKANIVKVLAEIAKVSMPPADKGYAPLKPCQAALVKAWAAGSTKTVGDISECKNLSPSKDPDLIILPIELMPLNYETLKTRILLPKCVLCHYSGNSDLENEGTFADFTTYESVVKSEYTVGDGTHSEQIKYWSSPGAKSKIHSEVVAEEGMPPLKSKLSKLTAQEVDFIDRWIDAGMPK